MPRSPYRALMAASLMVVSTAANALAQDVAGSMSGTVTDPDGAPLPGVAVTLDSAVVPSTTVHTRASGTYRFPTLPPSAGYALTFSLDGFETIVRDQLPVRLSVDTRIDVQMEVAGLEEAIVVSGESPIVDVKHTGVSTNLGERYMQSIPSARDPWVMLEHTGAVQISRQNIGGSESGQQSGFRAFGSRGSDTMWSYDGAAITDMAATGGSSTYFDFDAFEEISISTAGNDPSMQTGGIHINFVTKRGGNSWRGSGRFYVTDGALQASTVADSDGNPTGRFDADELFPGYTGNSIDNIKDFGAELGGPLVRDRLYGWGAYGRQEIAQLVGGTPDSTQLTNWHGKANWHLGDRAVLNYTFVHSNKTKQGRGAAANRPPETTFDQGGGTPSHTLKLQYTFDDDNYVEVTANRFNGGFWLEPQGGRSSQVAYDLATGEWGRSHFYYTNDSPMKNARVDGNSYLAGARVDHELKYGYTYRNSTSTSTWGPAGGAIAALANGQPIEAWLFQEAVNHYTGEGHGVYIGDTISAGRATINVGLRYDSQTSEALPSAAPAHQLAPEVFPAVIFSGFDPGFGWSSLSPRLGLTYDLSASGSARTILRLNAARYYSQMPSTELGFPKITTDGPQMGLEWSDLNGNGSIEAGETGEVLWVSGGWDPANPSAESPNQVLETSAPIDDELILGVEHEISRTFGVGVNFVYRRTSNYTWQIRAGEEDDAFWAPVTQQVDGYGDLTVYQPVGPRAVQEVYQQRHDYSTRHTGVELFLTKRFANRWMASASLAIGDTVQSFDGTRGYTDPTNVAATDGATVVPVAGQFGFVPFGARWYLKSSGMYRLGGGFSVAGYFQIRQGNLNPQMVRSDNRAFGAGRALAWVESIGETRVPTYWNLDLRGEKTIELGGRARLHLILDAFNLTNNAIVLERYNQVNSSNHDKITEVMQGRTIRLGARLVLR